MKLMFYLYDSDSKSLDMKEKLRVQSCRRRSARLSPDQKKQIIDSHNQTTEEKIQKYYQMLKEKKALELDLATRRKRVCDVGRGVVLEIIVDLEIFCL